MNVNIQSLGFRTTAALSQHAERRLRSAIARHGERIQRVLVRLGDANGPRGGIDKFCRIHVYLVDAPAAVIHDIGVDLYEVIDRAVDRAARAVSRHLDRARTFVRVGRAGADVSPGARSSTGPQTDDRKHARPANQTRANDHRYRQTCLQGERPSSSVPQLSSPWDLHHE